MSVTKKSKKLTEAEWRRVFDLRCRCKRGEHVAPEDMKLIRRAYAEDPARYTALEADVFEATRPFGSKGLP